MKTTLKFNTFNMTFLDTALIDLKEFIQNTPFNFCKTDYLEECVVLCEQLKYLTTAQVIYTNV